MPCRPAARRPAACRRRRRHAADAVAVGAAPGRWTWSAGGCSSSSSGRSGSPCGGTGRRCPASSGAWGGRSCSAPSCSSPPHRSSRSWGGGCCWPTSAPTCRRPRVQRLPRRAAGEVPAGLGVDRRRADRDGGPPARPAAADGRRRHPVDRPRRAHGLLGIPAVRASWTASRRRSRGGGSCSPSCWAACCSGRGCSTPSSPRAEPRGASARARAVRARDRPDLRVVRRGLGVDRPRHLPRPQRRAGRAARAAPRDEHRRVRPRLGGDEPASSCRPGLECATGSWRSCW